MYHAPHNQHPWLLLALIAVVTGVLADDAAPGHRVLPDYHPLLPGTIWEYEVREGDDLKRQEVELERTEHDRFLLTTRTGTRRARYELSQDQRGYRLHSIRYKLSFLPFSRTTRFEPPLVFLRTGAGDTLSWEWRGEASGAGRTLREADYQALIVDARGEGPPPDTAVGDLVVKTEFVEAGGLRHWQRAVYRSGIGLLSVEAEDYQKRLVRWKTPSASDWTVLDRQSSR